MNKFLSNVLIVLALAMCALCAYQWYRETRQREEVVKLNKRVFERDVAIQGYTNSIHIMDKKIAQLDGRVGELKDTVKTNEATMLQQKREIAKLEFNNVGLTNQLADYKQALETVQSRLKDAYDGIEKQNQVLKDVAAQRDDYINKLNESTRERNDIVAKYNELVKVAEKLQEELAKQAQPKQAQPKQSQPQRSNSR